MRSHPRLWTWLLLAMVLLSALGLLGEKKKKSKNQANPAAMQMDEQKRAIHVLNRFTFGPRPGDFQRLQAVGIDNWFEQ